MVHSRGIATLYPCDLTSLGRRAELGSWAAIFRAIVSKLVFGASRASGASWWDRPAACPLHPWPAITGADKIHLGDNSCDSRGFHEVSSYGRTAPLALIPARHGRNNLCRCGLLMDGFIRMCTSSYPRTLIKLLIIKDFSINLLCLVRLRREFFTIQRIVMDEQPSILTWDKWAGRLCDGRHTIG